EEVTAALVAIFNILELDFDPGSSSDSDAPDGAEVALDSVDTALLLGAVSRTVRSIAASAYLRNDLTSRLVGHFIREVSVEENEDNLVFSRLYVERDAWLKIEVLKHLAFQFLINTPRWKIVASRARQIIKQIFSTLAAPGG